MTDFAVAWLASKEEGGDKNFSLAQSVAFYQQAATLSAVWAPTPLNSILIKGETETLVLSRRKEATMFRKNLKKDPELFQNVSEGLRRLYRTKLFPLEDTYRFHDFHSPALEDADFDNKPMVLLVGQYSTGKTTFIRHLMEQDFPGMRIGPEPTTDSFIAVMHGEQEGVIPGNALVVDPKKPFRKLNAFGNAFLNR